MIQYILYIQYIVRAPSHHNKTKKNNKKQKTQAPLQVGLMTTTPRVVATAPGCAPPLQWQRAVEHLKHLIFAQT